MFYFLIFPNVLQIKWYLTCNQRLKQKQSFTPASVTASKSNTFKFNFSEKDPALISDFLSPHPHTWESKCGRDERREKGGGEEDDRNGSESGMKRKREKDDRIFVLTSECVSAADSSTNRWTSARVRRNRWRERQRAAEWSREVGGGERERERERELPLIDLDF